MPGVTYIIENGGESLKGVILDYLPPCRDPAGGEEASDLCLLLPRSYTIWTSCSSLKSGLHLTYVRRVSSEKNCLLTSFFFCYILFDGTYLIKAAPISRFRPYGEYLDDEARQGVRMKNKSCFTSRLDQNMLSCREVSLSPSFRRVSVRNMGERNMLTAAPIFRTKA